MIKCPRCNSTVQESPQNTCPRCFSPLGAAPLPFAQPSSPPPEMQMPSSAAQSRTTPVRVSLTGEEFIPASPAMPSATPASYAPSRVPPSQPPPSRYSAPRASVPNSNARREATADNSERSGFGVKAAVWLMVILCLTGGGWWQWMHRTNPKGQVQHLLHATQWLDWGVVWDLSSPKPGNKTRHEYVAMMNEPYDNPLLKIGARHSYEKIKFDVGEPVYRGEEATVSVSVSGSPFKRPAPIPVRLRNFGGEWKAEPIGENPLEAIGAMPTRAEKEAEDQELRQMIQKIAPPK